VKVDHAGIAPVRIDEKQIFGRPDRMLGAKLLDRKIRRRGRCAAAHGPRDGQVLQPADILGAAQRHAADMEAPGREGIAEPVAHREGREDHRHRDAIVAEKSEVASSTRRMMVTGAPTTAAVTAPSRRA